MKTPPDYFEAIKNAEIERWNGYNTSESKKQDLDVWKKSFEAIKRFRNVITELLQNADDAEASEVSIRIEKGTYTNRFIFGHNGRDFTEKEFRALCNFGESTKRNTQKIGYSGNGFKSTFSINKTVYLKSPTLSVKFDDSKFTIPIWTDVMPPDEPDANKKTYVIIPLIGINRFPQVDIDESLIFFKNIRKININDKFFEVVSLEHGPVKNSRWYQYKSRYNKLKVLKISSGKLSIPEPVLIDICRRRKADIRDYHDARLTIELMMKDTKEDNYIYATVPTNQETCLPVSINAPFILTPQGYGLMAESETRPMNTWIFENAGKLIAKTIHSWLDNNDLPLTERVEAYRLLPEIKEAKRPFEAIVLREIEDFIARNPIVLDIKRELVSKCYNIPEEIRNIWERETLQRFYSQNGQISILSREAMPYSKVLKTWNLIVPDDDKTIQCFTRNDLPVPRNKNDLLKAVKYILKKAKKTGQEISNLRIFIAEDTDRLCSLSEIFLPSDKFESLSGVYRSFIKRYITFADKSWISLLYSDFSEIIKDFCSNYLHNRKTTPDEELILYISKQCTTDDEKITLSQLASELAVDLPMPASPTKTEQISSDESVKNELDLCNEELAKYPNDLEILSKKGLLLNQYGLWNEAIDILQQVINIEPTAKRHMQLGLAYCQIGKFNEGLNEYESAIRMEPNNPEAHNCKGFVLSMRGKTKEAIEEYTIALQIDETYTDARLNLGFTLDELGDHCGALREYDKILQINPHDACAYFNKGISLFARPAF